MFFLFGALEGGQNRRFIVDLHIKLGGSMVCLYSMCVRVMNENVGCCRTMELCMAKYDHNDIPMYLSNSPFEEN